MFLFCLLHYTTSAYLVGFKDIDYSKSVFILNTTDSSIVSAFIEASAISNIQSTYLMCLNPSDCLLTSKSKAVYIKDSIQYSYLWEYKYEDFLEFFTKVENPQITPIDCLADLEEFERHQISFLFFYNKQEQLEAFERDTAEYYMMPFYFGAIFGNEIEKFKEREFPSLAVYGVDALYGYRTNSNFKEFIEKYKCPMLMAYTAGQWMIDCTKEKIVVFSVINKKRKGNWNLYAGQLKIYAHELREENNYSYQMMYIDSKKYPEFISAFSVPFIPYMLIKDYRNNRTYHLGEYNPKNQRKFFTLINSIKDETIDPDDYTVDRIEFTKYFTIWQILPLLFLVAGLCLLLILCFKITFTRKRKLN